MPPTKSRFEQLAEQLNELSNAFADATIENFSPPRMKRIRAVIHEAYHKISKITEKLDPIKHPGFVFDPSNPSIVGRFVGLTLVAQTRKPMQAIERFYGSGVYALYYRGNFPPYANISAKEHPIYVGKADPLNPTSKTATEQGAKLSNRLTEHRRTIAKATTTLRVEDFEYRALVVQTGWQKSAEDYLIHLFKPIWNNEVGICYGFGKHGDAPETRANLRSPWDTLHYGRDWAYRDSKMKDARSEETILKDIRNHFEKNPSFNSIDQILKEFLSDMSALL